jgi:carbon monoxide dehydrogenase subunit G
VRHALTVQVEVAAPAEAVWRAVTDWEQQGEWMLATRVEVTSPGEGRRKGATIRGVTSVGPLRFTDPMEIVEWRPPRCCVVRHTGRIVRGEGVFEVEPAGPRRAVFRWSELLELPFGRLGRVGWPLAAPAMRAGMALSVRRLARRCGEQAAGA